MSITTEANRCGLLGIILVSSELLRRFSGGRSSKIIAMAVADVLDVQHKATREGLRVFDLQFRLKRMGLSVDVELRLTERVTPAGHDFESVRASRGLGIGERRAPGTIESGRWYDIRIEIGAGEVVGFLDGKEVARTKKGGERRVFAIAGLDRAKNEIIIKAVNATAAARKCNVQLAGATPSGPARHIALNAASPEEENSVAAPRQIIPRERQLPAPAPGFTFEFPPWSVNVLRIPLQK